MNINEIAQLAGVSRATVSRYLNNGYVSQEKREAIAKVIKETGYQPSAQAQTLRTKKTNVIGVILPKINSDSISRIVAGISLVLNENGYQLLLAVTENQEEKELEYLRIFQENHVDGIILIATMFTPEHKRQLKKLQVPIVILGQHLAEYSSVYHDDRQAAKLVTQELLKGRAGEIGYIGVTKRDEAVGTQRREGFYEALKEGNVAQSRVTEEIGDFSLQSGYEKARSLMENSGGIDTIFCATDTIALGAVQYLKSIGKQIPREVQICGLGDASIGAMIEPTLTTVHFAYKTSGIEGTKILIDLINEKAESENGSDWTTKEVKIGCKLVRRNSTRK